MTEAIRPIKPRLWKENAEVERELARMITTHDPAARVTDAGTYIHIKDIKCYGSDGRIFEQHDLIAVAKDVVRKNDGSHASYTPYQAIVHFEKAGNGLFLPSYALQCNILVALFQNRSDPEVEKVLMQYKDYGPGYGWHNNNTVVDGKGGMIIHYPSKDDFPSHGGTSNINQALSRIPKSFPTGMDSSISTLEEALKKAQKLAYTKDLTGLPNPRILIDLAEYFGRTAHLYPATSSRTSSAWLGCGNGSQFGINSYDYLSSSGAARGVREP